MEDLDGDSKPEVVALCRDSAKIYIYKNLSDGKAFASNTFDTPVSIKLNPNNAPEDIVIAEVNGSGKHEITIPMVAANVVTILSKSELSGIDAISENNIHLYPNPSNGEFVIDLPQNITGSLISIYDAQGKLLKEMTGSEKMLVDFSSEKPGIYFLKSNKFSLRFMIVK